MSENMASSTSLGSRPRSATMRAYSSPVRPSSTARAAWSGSDGALKGQAYEELQAVGRSGQRVDRVLGVRHQAEHVALGGAQAGDVVLGSVRVVAGRVAQDDLVLVERLGRVETAGRVLDRYRQPVP